jgi:hypothetical protein
MPEAIARYQISGNQLGALFRRQAVDVVAAKRDGRDRNLALTSASQARGHHGIHFDWLHKNAA